MNIDVRTSTLGRACGNDLEAMRTELRTHTVAELISKYSVTHGAISGWVKKLGVHCARVCRSCNRKLEAAEMALTHNGHPSSICTKCISPQVLKDRERQRAIKARNKAKDEGRPAGPVAMDSSNPAIMALRMPLSPSRGYWNKYVDAGLSILGVGG